MEDFCKAPSTKTLQLCIVFPYSATYYSTMSINDVCSIDDFCLESSIDFVSELLSFFILPDTARHKAHETFLIFYVCPVEFPK